MNDESVRAFNTAITFLKEDVKHWLAHARRAMDYYEDGVSDNMEEEIRLINEEVQILIDKISAIKTMEVR